MAPPRLYDTPLEQLGRLMRDARAQGLPFDVAWDEIMRPGRSLVMTTTAAAPAMALRWPTDRTDRLAWHAAIVETQEQWRRAYELIPPTRPERALDHLGEAFQRIDEAALRRMVRGIGGRAALPSAA